MFGLILVKESHKEIKRYGFLFTCLSTRTIHTKCTDSLSINAFIQILWRFVLRRGNGRVMRTGNSINFTGASAELNKGFLEINRKKINEFMLKQTGQCIQQKRNPPLLTMWEEWECQIRSAASILVALLKIHGTSLNDESLWTFLAEVEAITSQDPSHQNSHQMLIV